MNRRTNGEGTIGREKDGRWRGRLRLSDGTRRSFYGKTKTEAAKKLAEAAHHAREGEPLPKERLTVADFLAAWLANSQHRLKPKTWQRYSEMVQLHLVPTLGRTRL